LERKRTQCGHREIDAIAEWARGISAGPEVGPGAVHRVCVAVRVNSR
jgi:hypothetical protein